MFRLPLGFIVPFVSMFINVQANAVILDSVTFSSEGKVINTSVAGLPELEINSVLDIAVDKTKLAKSIAAETGTPEGEQLIDDITAIKNALRATPEVQKQLITFRTMSLRSIEATAAVDSTKRRYESIATKVKALGVRVSKRDKDALAKAKEDFAATEAAQKKAQQEMLAASEDFSKSGIDLIKTLKPFKKSQPDLYGELNRAILSQSGYEALIPVLTAYLKKLDSQLAKKLEENAYQVLITAQLKGEGRTASLHLEGYDDIETGAPSRFGQFHLALDDRSRDEFAAARDLGKLVNNLFDANYIQNLRNELKKVASSFSALSGRVGNTETQQRLETLINQAGLTADPKVKETVDNIKTLVDSINKLASDLQSFETQDLMELISFTDNCVQRIKGIGEQIVILAAKIEELEKNVLSKVKNPQELQVAFEQLRQAISQELPATANALAEFQQIYVSFTNIRNLTTAAEEASRRAKDLRDGADLSTKLELQLLKAPRYPGDEVTITMIVSRNGHPLLKGNQRFRLEKIGWFWETRGALIFVDPISNGSNIRPIDFQPAPAISFNLHYGYRNADFWNRDLQLGVGPSIALLDFTDSSDFEVGIGINVTALQGLFWTGFGRNLQAKSNYIYVGINPLALADLFQQTPRK